MINLFPGAAGFHFSELKKAETLDLSRVDRYFGALNNQSQDERGAREMGERLVSTRRDNDLDTDYKEFLKQLTEMLDFLKRLTGVKPERDQFETTALRTVRDYVAKILESFREGLLKGIPAETK